jgi:hypothetical protein
MHGLGANERGWIDCATDTVTHQEVFEDEDQGAERREGLHALEHVAGALEARVRGEGDVHLRCELGEVSGGVSVRMEAGRGR